MTYDGVKQYATKYPSSDRAAVLPGTDRVPDASFDQAVQSFDRGSLRDITEAATRERLEVVRRFPIDRWPSMSLEDYALGTPNSSNSFCRWMEFQTPNIASIKGGSALKHMIFRRASGEWYF